MKRFAIKFGNGRCLMFDWNWQWPLTIRFGVYGKRAVDELHKITETLKDE